jgi:hypothetical protein
MKSNDQVHQLIIPWNFEHVPSNLLGRLIQGFFVGICIVGTHWWCWSLVVLEMHDNVIKILIFLLDMSKITRISSMDTTTSFLDINMFTKLKTKPRNKNKNRPNGGNLFKLSQAWKQPSL